MPMEYLRISVACAWNIYGISMEFLQNAQEIAMDYLWNTYGINLE